ncbi:MAG: hypothetical protein H6603_05750 [Flavobacteriales bacterium]|nr:hypothetical protein [Flavobacteriales bacterium]MCB9204463.1 hypothetical protein [Flavobacteriales bacterium]
MGKKINFIINWNYVTTVLAIVTIIFGLWITSNQNVSDELQIRIDVLKEENDKLSDELDPAWHDRINKQKLYYESLIEKQGILEKQKIDSLSQRIKKITGPNKLILTEDELRKVLRIMAEHDYLNELARLDSAQIQNLSELNRIRENQIGLQEKIIASGREIESNQRKIIESYERELAYSFLGFPTRRIILGILFISVSLLFTALFWILKNKR